jgi:hypothetical protein
LAEISKIFFSDTTCGMELKIFMNDHCKLLTKCCYFLDRLKIQDGHQRGTFKVNIATLWEICKTNFFSRTTGWIGTEPYLAEMFFARSLSSGVTFCSDRPPFKMVAVTKNRNFFNCPLLL